MSTMSTPRTRASRSMIRGVFTAISTLCWLIASSVRRTARTPKFVPSANRGARPPQPAVHVPHARTKRAA